jgi:hypothetical protein
VDTMMSLRIPLKPPSPPWSRGFVSSSANISFSRKTLLSGSDEGVILIT